MGSKKPIGQMFRIKTVLTMAIFQPPTTHGELQSFLKAPFRLFASSLVRGMMQRVYCFSVTVNHNFSLELLPILLKRVPANDDDTGTGNYFLE